MIPDNLNSIGFEKTIINISNGKYRTVKTEIVLTGELFSEILRVFVIQWKFACLRNIKCGFDPHQSTDVQKVMNLATENGDEHLNKS
jgi:hypothetical protein